MKSVIFHGILKAFGKKPKKVKAKTWAEICLFLQANVRNYASVRKKIFSQLDYCYFVVDSKLVEDIDLLDNKIKNGETIEVIPVIPQAAELTFIAVVKFIATIVASFAISYLMSQLMTPKDPKQVKTSSYIISGKTNLAARNTPVPVGYGRLRVAPPVINVMEINRDIKFIEAAGDSPQASNESFSDKNNNWKTSTN
jgi:predicted phage tail protein